jgi:hypothetical protein
LRRRANLPLRTGMPVSVFPACGIGLPSEAANCYRRLGKEGDVSGGIWMLQLRR